MLQGRGGATCLKTTNVAGFIKPATFAVLGKIRLKTTHVARSGGATCLKATNVLGFKLYNIMKKRLRCLSFLLVG